jgi:DNA/RNA endonuclease G (NUC1)
MRPRILCALLVCAALLTVLTRSPQADTAVQSLPLVQEWTDLTAISVDDDWSRVPGIIGYRGDGLAGATGVNPQTILAEAGSTGPVVDVIANQTATTLITGGVAEFHLTDPVVALQGSGTARAPHIVLTVSTLGRSNIHVSYTLRDIDANDNAIQPVALQYRVGTSGNYTNVPAGFVADASAGPGGPQPETPVSVDLPANAANQPIVQIRIITTDAVGSDEWIGIDQIRVTGIETGNDAAPAVTATTPANGATDVPVTANVTINFSEPVNAGANAFALQCAGSPRDVAVSTSPSNSFVLTPVLPLPNGATCTLTVAGSEITDTDPTDPPDQMAANFVLSFGTIAAAPPSSHSVVVISQVYGGGGNSGATYENDFVELFNRGSQPQDLTGWSLQYASAGGFSWDTWQPLGGTIAPGEYLLVALASGGAVGAPLPPANISGQINMSATSGKIALVNSFTLLEGPCPISDSSVMDFVGYGGATCQEGTTTAPAASNTTALLRRGDGTIDTDRNGADFVTGVPLPRQTAPIVELGPVVLTTDPTANRISVPRDPTIQITFTEPVETIGSWFSLSCENSGQHADATVAHNGVAQFITPNVNFTPGEHCTITIFKDQIHDLDTDDGQPNTDTLLADYSWSFTIATGAAPVYPPSVHLTMGNPSGAVASTTEPNNYLMEKPEYALSYNRDLGRPNWVSWHLSDEWIGSLTRFDTFRADPAIPADWYRVQSFDFAGSGFDRGHMVPNADRDKETSIPINQATFLMSNMVAQAPDNNQGPWADLENFLRTLLPANELYIVAGGVGAGGIGSNGNVTTTLANGHVTVPESTWKVALILPKGGDDITRATCSARTIAVRMPNTQGIRNVDWRSYLTSVDAVESSTGYNFFANLPAAVQRCIEAGTDDKPFGKNVPVFTSLAPAQVELGSATVTASGVLGVGDVFPTGQVAVSLAGVTVNAPIGLNGDFSATLPAATLALGGVPNTVSYSYAGDPNFTAAAATSTLTVVDTTAPAISGVTTTPGDLGVPNHKMIDVLVGYVASDLAGAPTCSLSVSSNEAANALGDGNTSVDWKVIDPHHVQLRAERSGLGSGRLYTLAVRCADGSGNVSIAVGTVIVAK